MNLNPGQFAALLLLRVYRRVVSPALRGIFGPAYQCRFTPSCSQYAIEAIQRHGVMRGAALAAWRIGRCQPWGSFGNDPVPEEFSLRHRHAEAGQQACRHSTQPTPLAPARLPGRN